MQIIRTHTRALPLFCRSMVCALLMALIWWSLNGGDAEAWWLGVPTVMIAVLTSAALAPQGGRRIRIRGLAGFVSFFLLDSVRGGIDVARRALHPRLPIAPTFIRYEFRIPEGPTRVFLANTVSLLPGTLSVELRDSGVLIHVLDERMPFAYKLRMDLRCGADVCEAYN